MRNLPIAEPVDGYTPEEEEILSIIGTMTISQIYGKLPTNRMKAIVALHFDAGYSKETVAEIFGVSRSRISQEVGVIRDILSGKIKPIEVTSKLRIKTVDELLSFIIHPD